MSGKAPPRAPRALLNSFPPTASSSSATGSQPSTSNATSAPGSSRLGAPPPTGPRSLINGRHLPTQPSTRGGPPPKSFVNGHAAYSTGPAGAPPTGPSARYLQKGKQVESSWGSQAGSSGASSSQPLVNGTGGPARHVTAEQSAPNGQHIGLNPKAPAISFRLRPPPPQPTTEPPPPPPPSTIPPPPPPPSVAPPPPPPPLSEPPPPPPPTTAPPPPPPPTSEPPPPDDSPPVPPSSQPPSFLSQPPPPSHPPPPQTSAHPPLPRQPPTGPRHGGHPHPPSEPSSEPPPLPPSPPAPKPIFYSLPPPPPYPTTDRSEFPEGKSFKVIFDPIVDKDRDGRFRNLIETVRAVAPDRVKGKGKGRETLTRFEGEVVEGEDEPVIRDPRADPKAKRLPCLRPQKTEFILLKYEYDANSCGPPPPTTVLVMNLSPLSPNQNIRRHFSVYGFIVSFEPQIDKSNGAALGIVLIKYNTHAEAKKCVEKENGKSMSKVMGSGISCVDGEDLKVVFDDEGKKLKAVVKELDSRRRQVREEKKRKEKEEKLKETNAAASKSTPSSSSATQTPIHGSQPWRNLSSQGQHHPPSQFSRHQHHGPQGSRPGSAAHPPFPNGRPPSAQGMANSPIPPSASNHNLNGKPNGPPDHHPARIRRPPASLVRARIMTSKPGVYQRGRPPLVPSESSSSTPIHSRGRRHFHTFVDDRDHTHSPWAPSRSPSPISRRPGQFSKSARHREHDAVLEELAKNGLDHVTIDGHGGQLAGAVREEDVRQFFDGFKVDKVLQDHLGWYVTFQTGDSARRAAMVLNSGARTLAHHSVNVSVHPAPPPPSASSKARWDDNELIDQAEKIIMKDLKAVLEKDIMERLVGLEIRRMVTDDRERRKNKSGGVGDEKVGVDGQHLQDHEAGVGYDHKPTTLKGLSFRKQKKRVREEEPKPVTEVTEVTAKDLDEEQPPRKKPKKIAHKKAVEEKEVESEDEDEEVHGRPVVLVTQDVHPRKRATSVTSHIDEPPSKKAKIHVDEKVQKVKKPPTKLKKPEGHTLEDGFIHEVLPDDLDFNAPAITQVRVIPGYESSLSPSPSPSPPSSPVLGPKLIVSTGPPPDPFKQGICDDDEDLYFAKLALSRALHDEYLPSPPETYPTPEAGAPPQFRVHLSGSARTEGYYKISHAEKSAYVAQYATRGTATEVTPEEEAPSQTQNVASSRSTRANARRRAQGLEEMNQVQRAMALSKGEQAATELVKFNQLQTRKKHLRFARSPIHDWGLYAMEKISRGEMVIEYVGEVIRAQVADKREKAYERQGIGSSYLFRIDEDLVVDATKKGNLGRLINHSCDPNCTAKIITINGEKKIVIYAKQEIELGSEITYDYHFPIEQDKIPCLCGSAKCRGYLN